MVGTTLEPKTYITPKGVHITGLYKDNYAKILTLEALEFITQLHRWFNPIRKQLLENRLIVQEEINHGKFPTFLKNTKMIREQDWKVLPVLEDLQDRRVEITGPVDRKMVINALNSGAKVFMADFEDANAPTWANNIEGQINLRDANRRNISFTNPKNGKQYALNETTATLMVRPRGWHLDEKNVTVDGEFISGSLFDFGLYFFHNATELIQRGSGPYFYLPKLEHHLEARLWNTVFVSAQKTLGIEEGTIKATVLLETILAAFQMDELLWELRQHSAGLNCGRWDYIFSFIKRFRNHSAFVMPDRGQVTMNVHCMKSYSKLLIKTCHRRNAHAMGGMAAQIPIKNNPEANEIAFGKVAADKLREAKDGHDGTWVAHPGLVKTAMDIFNEYMPNANQIDNKRLDVNITEEDLLAVPKGTITEAGIRENINVSILYIESWLQGNGAAALYHKMEDAATAEISRTQLWQWIQNASKMDTGGTITQDLIDSLIPKELEKIEKYVGTERYNSGRFKEAIQIFNYLLKDKDFPDFLTLEAYKYIK
ncbi:MAG: malate synthase [Paraglaciecola sp.]|jgi:malate synthase